MKIRQKTLAPGACVLSFCKFGATVECEQSDAMCERPSDITRFLDRVAIGNTVRRRADIEAGFDFREARGIEIRAERQQRGQNFLGRVRFNRIENIGLRQGPRKIAVIPGR